VLAGDGVGVGRRKPGSMRQSGLKEIGLGGGML